MELSSFFCWLVTVVGALSREVLSLQETEGSPMYAQSVHVTMNSTVGGGCVGEGRCKPCSKLEMSRQVNECLRTGYRQWAYCPSEKAKKYVSCHYQVDPHQLRAFWLFQAVALLTGSLSLAVVHWRHTRLERIVTHRIEQQIRA